MPCIKSFVRSSILLLQQGVACSQARQSPICDQRERAADEAVEHGVHRSVRELPLGHGPRHRLHVAPEGVLQGRLAVRARWPPFEL